MWRQTKRGKAVIERLKEREAWRRRAKIHCEISHRGEGFMQVCVQKDATDEQVLEWAREYIEPRVYFPIPEKGWHIVRDGDALLGTNLERTPCKLKPSFVHIVLH